MKQTMNPVVASAILVLFAIATNNLTFCCGSTYLRCIESEREALLKFKQDLKDPSNRLASWINVDGADCCSWAGVVCDDFTGHIFKLSLENPFSYLESDAEYANHERSKLLGKINPSLLDLKHLIHLDLSGNDFQGIQIPKYLGFMHNLTYLNLSHAGFGGMVPHQVGNLSNLQYLDLSHNYYDLLVDNLHWLSGLSSLKHLDLSYTDLGKASDWLFAINLLSSLEVLKLQYSQLYRFPPLSSVNFSSLTVLDLSLNQFDSSSIPNWVFDLSHLVYLDLSYCFDFEGSVPEGLQNLTSLRYLDLSSNNFNSSIPNWLYKFRHLEYLSLRGNSLQGSISDALENLTASVEGLDLSFNTQLEGKIPRSFSRFCNLRSIDLSYVNMSRDISEILNSFSNCNLDQLETLVLYHCQIFGHLTNQIGQFKNLEVFSLEGNSISGTIPYSLGEISSLQILTLSDNKLNGYLSEIHFANLSNLLSFHISENSLILNVSHDWVPPFQLQSLGLRSCHLGPRFPSWLLSQIFLTYLDISNSGIFDTVPHKFWDSASNLRLLNFSHNSFYGEISNLSKVTGLYILDLSSNNLSGSLPLVFSNNTLYGIDLSNNAFSGSIFNLLCNGIKQSKKFQVLNLGDNFLSGEIPDCWMNYQWLEVLTLGDNKFTGNIPPSMGALNSLQSLHLQNNLLSGMLPESLKNCTELLTLDVGYNKFFGNVPTWIGERFSRMVILILRSNMFGGVFPTELCRLTSLQILDVAYNNLTGVIPRCISNFSSMTIMNYSLSNDIGYPTNFSISVDEETLLVMKGKMLQYSSTLNLVRIIDLSRNNFFGEIPIEVTNLGALQSLNLSHNFFTGRIPASIGAMRSIESIDFSSNQLYGKIPQSISSLTFLSHLNLSYNNMTGKIPLSAQLQSFNASCFTGNDLCGSPLPKNCTDQNVSVPAAKDENGDKDEDQVDHWLFASIALGFVVGFWCFTGPLLVNRRWRFKYCHFLDYLGEKVSFVVGKHR